MSKVSINYTGGIDDKEKQTNLTGSQTIFSLDIGKTRNPRIVIDSGAIQGVKKALELNKKIPREVLSADALVITHAHSDHAGMVPYIYKKGFSGKIIMTELTKLQCKEMWLDYVRLTRNEIEEVTEMNSKIAKKLHEAIQIIEHVKIIKSSKTKNKKFKASESYLVKILGEKNIDIAFSESAAILKEYGVETEADISSVLREIPELLFDENDVELIYNKIETLELGEELELQSYHPISSGTDKIIDELPKMVKNGFNKQVPILHHLKGTVTSKLLGHIKKISKEVKENETIQKENEELAQNLKLALNFVGHYKENGINIATFEDEYGELLKEDVNKLLEKIETLIKIDFKGNKYDINELINIYHSFKFPLPKSKKDYEELKEELKELEIFKESDIDKHLPELPDRDYENKDIKAVLKKAIITNNSDINIGDYAVFINEINQFSPGEVLSFLKSGKRVYCSDEIATKLLDKVIEFVQTNNDNIKRNNELRDALSKAYDLVQIYEGNKELYLENNKKDYLKRLKFVTNYKKTPIQEVKYNIDELDYIIDLDYTSIAKTKTIIHIKRLDDSRIYDILFNSNFNTVYYFEPKIRERIKEKLSEYIKRIDNEKRLEDERYKSYLENIEFVRIYEGKQKLEISENEYKQAKELLKKHSISSKNDINNFNFFNVDYPYTLKDVENYFRELITTSNDFSINSIDVIHITSIDDERIYDLPYIYEDNSKLIVIDETLKEKVRKKLLSGIGDFFKTSTIRRKKRTELLEKLKLFQEYTKNYEYLFDIENFKSTQDFLNNLLFRISEIRGIFEKINKIKLALDLKSKLTEGDSQREVDYKQALDLLEKYKVKNENDISKILKVPHFIPYSIDDVKKAISLLKSVHIDKNSDILESIKLNFFDAGHIEGSVQAVLTMVVSEVDNVLNGGKRTDIKTTQKRKLKHINYGFSGDLGRIKDPNLSGTPKKIPFKLDYYQMEATYAERVHLDKEISIKRLFSSIESAGGKILIPAFSIQRTQEVLMILLQKRLDSQDDINKIKELTKEKRKKETELSGFSKNLSDKAKLEEKEALEEEIERLELNINYLKAKVFDIDIILDSPLSEKITEIYIEKCGEKYNLLDKKVQKELFGKEIISYVKKTGSDATEEENDGRLNIGDLYTPERRDKKEIIISASGMGDGGAILPHLKENLPNPKSKIIAVGYAPENTRLGKIKLLDEFISITGEVYDLKCEVDDIPGFSGHIDEEEMIILLTQMEFKKGAILALTHGDEKRFALAEKIQKAMDEIGKKIKIVVPKLLDSTTIKI